MTSIVRRHDGVGARIQYFRTLKDTMFLYPMADIERGLAATTFKYTFDGANIVCPDMTNMLGVQTSITEATLVSQPVGNAGFSLGVGTLVQDMNREIDWKLTSGELVYKWRLVKQITPQRPVFQIPNPGNSPNDTVGFITVMTAYATKPDSNYNDLALLARLG